MFYCISSCISLRVLTKSAEDEDDKLLDDLEGVDVDMIEVHSDSRDDDDVLLEIEEMINR